MLIASPSHMLCVFLLQSFTPTDSRRTPGVRFASGEAWYKTRASARPYPARRERVSITHPTYSANPDREFPSLHELTNAVQGTLGCHRCPFDAASISLGEHVLNEAPHRTPATQVLCGGDRCRDGKLSCLLINTIIDQQAPPFKNTLPRDQGISGRRTARVRGWEVPVEVDGRRQMGTEEQGSPYMILRATCWSFCVAIT